MISITRPRSILTFRVSPQQLGQKGMYRETGWCKWKTTETLVECTEHDKRYAAMQGIQGFLFNLECSQRPLKCYFSGVTVHLRLEYDCQEFICNWLNSLFLPIWAVEAFFMLKWGARYSWACLNELIVWGRERPGRGGNRSQRGPVPLLTACSCT